LHIGTDGAGSIRIPAAFTGVFGIKPSFGRVAAYPASPFSILAHVGPLTRSVADAALMLSVIGGPDERDMTAWNTLVPDYRVGLDDGVRGLRVAWSPRLGYFKKLHPEVEAAAREAAQVFGELGAIVEEADPDFPDPYEMIMTLWGASRPRSWPPRPSRIGRKMDPGFLKMAEMGRKYSLSDYLAAFTAAPTSPTRWRASMRHTTCCSRHRCRSRRSKPAASHRPTAAMATTG
jgi:aspartyl-tRNA(Asn)/glutamyl-tRNA(Gln) amidotransferase subunit A